MIAVVVVVVRVMRWCWSWCRWLVVVQKTGTTIVSLVAVDVLGMKYQKITKHLNKLTTTSAAATTQITDLCMR